MKKPLRIAAVLAGLLVVASVQAAVVLNSGFELAGVGTDEDGSGTGPGGNNFLNWAESGPVGVTVDAAGGAQASRLGLGVGGSVSQSIAGLVVGTTYTLDFWAKVGLQTDTPPQDGPLHVDLPGDGTADFVLTQTYTHFFKTYLHVGAADTLTFDWGRPGDADYLSFETRAFIDNVNLTVVPEPITILAGALLLIPIGVSTLRILRTKRVA
ncbi:MAG: hypothetical protein L0Z50_09635 [Verrucomicrobiales bacterium]|nr:hypothetical protein [Verrucomicrobiales bacterium]